jgi:hypothetical protein
MFPEKVVPVIFKKCPEKFCIPPPAPVAVLLETVQFIKFTVPGEAVVPLLFNPPPFAAELPVTTTLVKVKVPPLL